MKKLFTKLKTAGTVLFAIVSLLFTSCVMKPKEIHGDELLKLNDSQLYEKVYLQTLDLVESFADEETALSQISPVCRTFYILSIYDMEVQNGGLCQFFVNSSRLLAPYVNDCLKTVNAEEHRKLFSAFVSDNNIDLQHLESFEIEDVEEYADQTERYDFDTFDNAYIALTPLQDYLVSYIKSNISEF